MILIPINDCNVVGIGVVVCPHLRCDAMAIALTSAWGDGARVQRVELGLEASDAEEEGVVREFEDRELD